MAITAFDHVRELYLAAHDLARTPEERLATVVEGLERLAKELRREPTQTNDFQWANRVINNRRRQSGADNPVCWNPWNKVVQDHRDGTIDLDLTNSERFIRNLPVPWTPEIGSREVHEKPVF